MVFEYTDAGRDFFENAVVDDTFTDIVDTISVGDGTSVPSTNDTDLDNVLYEDDTSAENVVIERGSTTGEIRGLIEFTGGTEVPSDSDITEVGFKTANDTLVYRERRNTEVTVGAGETKILEVKIFIEDVPDNGQVITDVGREYVADRAIGTESERIDTIAVGTSTDTVAASDTSMDEPVYSADDANSNVIVDTTSNVGDIRAEITLSAGTDQDDQLPADTNISEFGLFSNGILVLHEKRVPVTLEGNDTKTFKIPLRIIQ